MKIYVASSWRCQRQPAVVKELRRVGHDVYDFRNPPNGSGFAWQELDKDWKNWDAKEFKENLLTHPTAARGFMSDFRAMRWCDAIVMVLPCGKSAHMELGWATGAGKRSIILLEEDTTVEPELMYLQADHICLNLNDLHQALNSI